MTKQSNDNDNSDDAESESKADQELDEWLSEEIEMTDWLGINAFLGATYLPAPHLRGELDNREAMRVGKMGEIVWYQAEEHMIVTVYPDYSAGHSYGLVSMTTGIPTVAHKNAQGWGCKTREEWELVHDLQSVQLYPKPAVFPEEGRFAFLRDLGSRLIDIVADVVKRRVASLSR
jgi:hypothetical protein